MVREKWICLHNFGPQPLSSLAYDDGRGGVEYFRSQFHRDMRIRRQIAMPIEIRRRAEIGRGHIRHPPFGAKCLDEAAARFAAIGYNPS